VHFVVSGFHHIVVFQRGIRLESLQASGPAPFLNDPNQPVYYNGFNPGPPGPSNPLATPVPNGLQRCTESCGVRVLRSARNPPRDLQCPTPY
jgi:hypothetical protein